MDSSIRATAKQKDRRHRDIATRLLLILIRAKHPLGLSLRNLGARIRYRRLRRAGTRTPGQSWRQNIYVRKLDRLFGRASWKFLRSYGNHRYWVVRSLPEFPGMETPSELAINNVGSANHCRILRSSLWQRPLPLLLLPPQS
jgi:hypothetical protein